MTPKEFLLSYFPAIKADLISSAQNEQLRIDVFSTAEQVYFVVSSKEGETFIPKMISDLPHIPYNLNLISQKPPAFKERGVYVEVIDIYEPAVEKIRIKMDNIIEELNVVSGRACMFFWDSTWIQSSQYLKVLDLFCKGQWVPVVTSKIISTKETFFNAYIEYCRSGKSDFDWTWDGEWAFFKTPEDRQETHQVIQLFVDQFEVKDSHMAVLAAGAIENSLSHEFLDYVIADKKNRKKWQGLLAMTYYHSEPKELKERILAFLK